MQQLHKIPITSPIDNYIYIHKRNNSASQPITKTQFVIKKPINNLVNGLNKPFYASAINSKQNSSNGITQVKSHQTQLRNEDRKQAAQIIRNIPLQNNWAHATNIYGKPLEHPIDFNKTVPLDLKNEEEIFERFHADDKRLSNFDGSNSKAKSIQDIEGRFIRNIKSASNSEMVIVACGKCIDELCNEESLLSKILIMLKNQYYNCRSLAIKGVKSELQSIIESHEHLITLLQTSNNENKALLTELTQCKNNYYSQQLLINQLNSQLESHKVKERIKHNDAYCSLKEKYNAPQNSNIKTNEKGYLVNLNRSNLLKLNNSTPACTNILKEANMNSHNKVPPLDFSKLTSNTSPPICSHDASSSHEGNSSIASEIKILINKLENHCL